MCSPYNRSVRGSLALAQASDQAAPWYCHGTVARSSGLCQTGRAAFAGIIQEDVTMAIRIGQGLNRRKLLRTLGSTALITGVSGIARPYLSRAADRPAVSHGVQSGDVSTDSGM